MSTGEIPHDFDDAYDEYAVAYVHHHTGFQWPVRNDAVTYRSREDAQESLPRLDARSFTGHHVVVRRTVAVTDWEDDS